MFYDSVHFKFPRPFSSNLQVLFLADHSWEPSFPLAVLFSHTSKSSWQVGPRAQDRRKLAAICKVYFGKDQILRTLKTVFLWCPVAEAIISLCPLQQALPQLVTARHFLLPLEWQMDCWFPYSHLNFVLTFLVLLGIRACLFWPRSNFHSSNTKLVSQRV